MALSNILREPRRELIEQGIGLAAVMAIIAIDLIVASVMCLLVDGTLVVPAQEFLCAACFAVPIVLIVWGLLIAMHAVLCSNGHRRKTDPFPTSQAIVRRCRVFPARRTDRATVSLCGCFGVRVGCRGCGTSSHGRHGLPTLAPSFSRSWARG